MLARTSTPDQGTPAEAEDALRVLVVDDIEEIGAFYRALFVRIRDVNAKLDVQTDPREAIRSIREGRYDLVISDFRMRNADGIEVLRAARETHPAGRRVLMTGYNEVPTSIERICLARVDAYVQKPLKAQDLLLLICDLLVGDAKQIARYRADANEMEAMALREERIRSLET